MNHFLTFFLLHFALILNLSALTYETMTAEMKEENLINTGLYKLTEDEQKQLNLWLQFHSGIHYLALPKVSDSSEFISFVKTEARRHDFSSPLKKWKLALVAVFQNETPYIREFIDFHKRMGVEHFFLYDNMSSDNFYPEIQEYIDNGEVELFEWPVRNFVNGQCSCYTDAVYRCKGKADWLIFADTDLFFFPLEHDNLPELLKYYDHPKIGGLTVNLLYFGTSGVEKIHKGEKLTELLTRCASDVNDHVRCIVRPERVETVNNPHFAKYYPQYFAVDENFSRNEGPLNKKKPIKKIRANHYALRTLDFLKNEYGLRHARFQAEKNGKPFPTEISSEIWEALIKLDAEWSVAEDREIQRFDF